MFYVLQIKGYRYEGRLFPFKKVGHLKVTIYAIYQHPLNATNEAKKFLPYCDSVTLIKTERITREIFLKQSSSCAIFEGCKAQIKHQCKNDYPIHLWYDPAKEGVGFFCEDAIKEMAKQNYPFTLQLRGTTKPIKEELHVIT